MSLHDFVSITSLIRRLLIGLFVIEFATLLLIPAYSILGQYIEDRSLTASELREFIDNYSTTPQWALSAILVSLISVTIGPRPGFYFDIAIIFGFILPASHYFVSNSPFGLWISMESNRVSTGKDVIYEIDLYMTTGTNIEDYNIFIDIPPGMELRGFQQPDNKHKMDEDGYITGEAPLKRDNFTLGITLEEGSSSRNEFRVLDGESGEVIDTIELK